jgi:hypothetical protein
LPNLERESQITRDSVGSKPFNEIVGGDKSISRVSRREEALREFLQGGTRKQMSDSEADFSWIETAKDFLVERKKKQNVKITTSTEADSAQKDLEKVEREMKKVNGEIEKERERIGEATKRFSLLAKEEHSKNHICPKIRLLLPGPYDWWFDRLSFSFRCVICDATER